MSAAVLVDASFPKAESQTALIDALHAHLASLAALVRGLDDDVYRATPSRTSGSIGEHVRHCLDHAKALIAAVDDDAISYDSRLRGTAVERQPACAAAELNVVRQQLNALDDATLERPIALFTMTHRDAPSTAVETTIGREVAFVIQHTIHHCALVAMLLDRLGLDAPPQFGYAPSTPARR
jgi:uncharacterized damage-inducible protein DinB